MSNGFFPKSTFSPVQILYAPKIATITKTIINPLKMGIMSGEKSLNGFTEMKKIARKPRIPRIHARYMTRSVRVVVVIIGDSIVIFEKFSTIFCLQIFYHSRIFANSVFFIIAYFCNNYFGF